MKIRDDFHHLIDSIEDEQLLQHYYQLLQKGSSDHNGPLWNSLTEAQKQEVLIAYDESFDSDNLISHQQVRVTHEKWLRP